MSQYAYRAYDPGGAIVSGEISAGSMEIAESELIRMKLTPLMLTVRDTAKVTKGPAPVTNKSLRLKPDELLELLRSLHYLLQSGVPLIEGLDGILEAQPSVATAHAVASLKTEVLAGRSLSDAMRMQPNAFTEILVDMVAVADEGGNLVDTIDCAATYVERSNEMRRALGNAFLYPAVLTGLAFLTFLGMIVFVLPNFAQTFSAMNVKLPAITNALVNLGQLIRDHTIEVLLFAVMTFFGGRRLFAVPSVKSWSKRVLYRLPIFGDLLTKIALARSLHTLGSLLITNYPMMRALESGALVSGHPGLSDAFLRVRTYVENGSSLSEAMARTKAFPGLVVQITGVGEKSGKLPVAMLNIAEQTRYGAEKRLKAVMSLFEPLLIIVMGVVVGLLTVSMLGPIFSLNQSIK